MDEKTLNQMIENGEIGTMTECAYGEAVANTESDNIIKNKKKKDIDNEEDV